MANEGRTGVEDTLAKPTEEVKEEEKKEDDSETSEETPKEE